MCFQILEEITWFKFIYDIMYVYTDVIPTPISHTLIWMVEPCTVNGSCWCLRFALNPMVAVGLTNGYQWELLGITS